MAAQEKHFDELKEIIIWEIELCKNKPLVLQVDASTIDLQAALE